MITDPIILGIESSCDDTSASIIYGKKILSNIIYNQEIHIKYGGVVPELASRQHQKNIVCVIDQAITKANISLKDLYGIAFTKKPGLIGSLLVGESFAKSMSLVLNIPLIEVNHIEAHILCHFIEDKKQIPPPFPFICLTVSGGHTQIVEVQDFFKIKVIGETLDDAAGEAFDKIGKLLGLNYPAGKYIDELSKIGNVNKFIFPIPKTSNFSFSFSGIKTAFLYFIKKELKKDKNFIKNNLHDLCASIQHTIIQTLINKIHKYIIKSGIKNIAISGGVSANSYLRNELIKYSINNNCYLFLPKIEFTTDNAAMIALIGSLKYIKKEFYYI